MGRVQQQQVVQVALISARLSAALGFPLSGLVPLNANNGTGVTLMLKVQWRLACTHSSFVLVFYAHAWAGGFQACPGVSPLYVGLAVLQTNDTTQG